MMQFYTCSQLLHFLCLSQYSYNRRPLEKVVAPLVKRYAVLLFHNRAKTSAAIFRNYGKEFITLLHADFTFRKFGEEL